MAACSVLEQLPAPVDAQAVKLAIERIGDELRSLDLRLSKFVEQHCG